MPLQTENYPLCQEWSPYKMRVVTTKAFLHPSTTVTVTMCCDEVMRDGGVHNL